MKVFVLFVHFDVLFVGVCLVGDSLVDEKVTRVLYNYVETHKVMKTLFPIKGKFEICLPLFL